MATTNYPGLNKTINYALPTFTLLLGSTGVFTGLFAANNVQQSSKSSGFPTSSSPPSAVDRALFRAIGARNTASGLSLLGLMALYGLTRWDGLGVASTTIKRCVGVCLAVGVTVGLADGQSLLEYADESAGETNVEEVRERGNAHMVTAGLMGVLALGWLVV